MGNRDALRAKNKQLQKERLNTQKPGPETQVDEVLKGVAAEAQKQANTISPNSINGDDDTKSTNTDEMTATADKINNKPTEVPVVATPAEVNESQSIDENKKTEKLDAAISKQENHVISDIKERVDQAEKELIEAEEPTSEENQQRATNIEKSTKIGKSRSKKIDEIKKTSLNISRSSLAYLAVNSKLQKINQNELLSIIIKEEQDKKIKYKIDYNIVPTKTSKSNTTIKAVQLPESQIEFLKSVSAIKMKSVSEFVDQLIQNKIMEEDN